MAALRTLTNGKIEILMVEDSPIQAEILKKMLVKQGYIVTVAKNGAEGLEKARRKKPTLLVSDIAMPVMDGYQMCVVRSRVTKH